MPLKAESAVISEEDEVHVPVAATSDSDLGGPRRRRLRLLSETSSTGRRGFKLPGITFRRRRDGEQDKDKGFWNAVMILSFVALAVLTVISFVLAQTEFFITHQVDLLGVSVDKIFSVVSEEKTTIYLHNTGHLPGKAAFNYEDHVLSIGRMKASTEDSQAFYGFNVFHNGTVGYTNELKVPNVETKSLHADSVIFNDGTTMTTAADVSGGLVQEGDLNFASQKGSIVAATSGKQRFVINPEGFVVIPDPDAMPPDEPNKIGLVLDGQRKRLSLAGQMDLYADKTSSTIMSHSPLSIAANDIFVGREGTERVRLTCPDLDKLALQKPIRLEITGQFSSSSAGGSVVVAGGDGSSGGQVHITGGHAATDATFVGPVFINAMDETSPMTGKTFIGTNSSDSAVVVQGTVHLNAKASDLPVEIGGKISLGGLLTSVTSTDVAIGDKESTKSVGLQARQVTLTSPTLTLSGDQVHVSALQALVNATTSLSIASPKVDVTAGSVSIHTDATTWSSGSLTINSNDTTANVQIHGNILLGSQSNFAAASQDKMTAIGGASVYVGDAASTKQVVIQTTEKIQSRVNGSTLTVSTARDKAMVIEASNTLVVGSTEFTTSVRGKALYLSSSHVQLGDASAKIDIQGVVTVNGKPLLPNARRLDDAVSSALWLASGGLTDLEIQLLEPFSIQFTAHDGPTAKISPSTFELSTTFPSEYAQFALSINGLRAEMAGLDDIVPLLVRCQVHQQVDFGDKIVVLETSTVVDLCPTTVACLDDPIAPTLSGQSIRKHMPSSSYSVSCAVKPRAKLGASLATWSRVRLRYDRVDFSVRHIN
ncbi:hypothetical protein AC1031_013166 [Aphanomyces cochlioides]|nr:hypothetical protein AC1031_013166 [Aphanomyces cochlioides]